CAADDTRPIATAAAATKPLSLKDMRSLHVESFVNDSTLIDAEWLQNSASNERLHSELARAVTVPEGPLGSLSLNTRLAARHVRPSSPGPAAGEKLFPPRPPGPAPPEGP